MQADLEDDLHECRQKSAKFEETMLYWKALYERRLKPASETDASSNYTQEPEGMDKENLEEMEPRVLEAEEEPRNNSMRYGMMRHEISHRFKRVWMAMQKVGGVGAGLTLGRTFRAPTSAPSASSTCRPSRPP